ncbi:hypothetical protein [Chryseobacterium oranimense]|uniref:hypothetical protein n=1 Tax=Chryseobacterium oranimense TaxID=421058 RepID=UPI0031D4B52E
MKLVPIDVSLKEIMIDKFNPRFTKEKNISQEELISEMLQSKSSKELLRSLQEDIKWVNRIVIQELSNHEHYESFGAVGTYQYVAVEGNTRLACLKSGAVNDYDENTIIPVLFAEKEEDESIEDFRKEIRITQGIANVTVVKEWSPISKAKHLLALYNDVKGISKPAEIYKQISNELGIGIKEVRESVVRYMIFNKISEISEPIPEDNWGYLEAFDKNAKIRSLIGLDIENNEFIKDDDEYYDEIFENIPELIKQALRGGLNTKQFRDIIFEIAKESEGSEEFSTVITEIVNEEISLISKAKKNEISDRDQWVKNLDEILKQIASFPNMAEWAIELVEQLRAIEEKTSKQIRNVTE